MSSGVQRKYTLAGTAVLLAAVAATWVSGSGVPAQSSNDITVFAAASLRVALDDVAAAFARSHPTAGRIYFNIAGSNVLAQQILASSQADVFVSANEVWMERTESAGRLIADSRRPLLGNRLAIVANLASDWRATDADDLAGIAFTHLSMGDPAAVPAGLYAKRFLENTEYQGADLWTAVAARVAPALDVRAALALVEADPSVIGIVYKTDAAASDRVRILWEFPPSDMDPIRYFAARVKRRDAPSTANAFFDFLFSDEASAIFADHGFDPLARTAGDT